MLANNCLASKELTKKKNHKCNKKTFKEKKFYF